jgi:response regulator RpfG family c-di-GMP phosphodiesterase
MSGGRDSPTVLAVDDLEDYLDLYEYRLDDEYEVLTAENGETALDVVSAAVDVVLLDRDLPGMSADAVLGAIRDGGYDCRVATVTADEPDDDVIEVGFDAYLTKPVSETALNEVVDRLLTITAYLDAVDEYHAACERRAKRGEDAVDASIRDLRKRVDDLADQFDDEDYRVVFRDLRHAP